MSLDSNAEREAAREEYYRQCSTLTDKCHAFEEGWLAGRSRPSEWVATSERMPPECEHVLFADVRGGVHKGYQATRNTYGENDEETPITIWCAPDYAGGEEWEAGDVSHWTPLPKPPALLPPNTEAK